MASGESSKAHPQVHIHRHRANELYNDSRHMHFPRGYPGLTQVINNPCLIYTPVRHCLR